MTSEYIFSDYIDFNDFITKNHLSKQEGIQIIIEHIDDYSEQLRGERDAD